jgi:nitroreductase
MEFFDVLEARHSIRAYDPRPVEPERLQQILEAANGAPSAGDLQAYEIYMVCGNAQKASLVNASGGQEFLAQAPINLVFCAHAALSAVKYAVRGTQLYCVQDASIACTFAMLAATAFGLSTVWVGAFDEDAVRSAIGAPADQRPVAILPIGYAAESPRIGSRRKLIEIIHQVN